MRMAPEDIILACDARVRQKGRADVFLAFATDSRHAHRGDLFFALKGPHFDGHAYVKQAFRKGAVGAVVEKGRRIDTLRGRWVFAVNDSLRALGDAAAQWRQRHPIAVIGITGSNGKTTTKEMISQVLETRFRVLKTQGNFNNLVGLPLTLGRLKARHEIAVLEMGMNQPGEIDRLAAIAHPQVGVITSVARAHLEGLGSLRAVARAKGELLSRLPREGLAILNADDPRVLQLSSKSRAPVLTYGFSADADIRARKLKTNDLLRTCFEVRLGKKMRKIQLELLGRHNANNALAALAVGQHFQVPITKMIRALKKVTLPSGRMQRISLPGRILVIHDAYNANPDSVLQALETFAKLPQQRRKVLVLGDMLELGAQSQRLHREVGEAAARAGIQKLVAVGERAEDLLAGAKRGGLSSAQTHLCHDAREAGILLHEHLQCGDLVLLKGSRGVHLERALNHITRKRAA